MKAVADLRSLAELLRLPSVLTVPGDTLLGASASRGAVDGRVSGPGVWRSQAGMALASSCLYLAGIALNDYADRQVDALERPERPIPSGRVDPRFALALSAALTAAGLLLCRAGGGRRAMPIALPLAGVVWAYDLALKQTAVGPLAMASARTLDVLLGAGGDRRAALAPGLIVGAHTLTISAVSRREVQGATRALPAAALVGFVGVASAAGRFASGAPGRRNAAPHPWSPRRRAADSPWPARQRAASLALLGMYLASVGRAALEAVGRPTPGNLRRVVGSGVLAFMPLEAAMAAATSPSPLPRAAAVAAAWTAARRLSRRRALT